MGEGGGTRKSSRVPTETEKRKAADEGSEEQLKKKIRALEEKNVKLTGTNTALSDAVQALHKEKVDTCRNTNTANNRGTNNDNDDGNNNEDDDNDGNDDGDDGGDNGLPVLFNAGKITITNRSNPDVIWQKKHTKNAAPEVGGEVVLPRCQDTLFQDVDTSTQPSTPPEPIVIFTHRHTGPPIDARPYSPPSRPESPSSSSIKNAGPLLSPQPSMRTPGHPWPPAPFAPGVDAKTPKNANKVYDRVVANMLTRAQHKFECLLFTEDAYPDINTQIRWSYECWEAVCAKSNTCFELSKEMMNLVKARCSHGRGVVLQRIRPVVGGLFIVNTKSESMIRKNANLATKLLWNNAFYYVRGTIGKRRFEDETMLRALQSAFFNGPRSCAASNHTKFNPVPLETIALVCTIMEHCLREWETGIQIIANLDETVDAPRYRTHMTNHTIWRGLDNERTAIVLKHISRKLFESCGSKSKLVETTGSVSQETLEKELAMLREWREYDTEEEI